MPLFTVHALDEPGALQRRLDHYGAHRAYVEQAEQHHISVVMSGPLQSPDGETMIGSLFLIEAENQTFVESFVQADPFETAGVWATVSICRFHRRKG